MHHQITDEKIEIIKGVMMPLASPTYGHGAVAAAIAGAVNPWRGMGGHDRPGGWWIGSEVDVELDDNLLVPDLAGWRIDKMPEAPSERPVRRAPDWVCEILSPSTAGRDVGHKQACYHRAGVGHLWIIEPHSRIMMVMRRGEDGYTVVSAGGAAGGDTVTGEPFADLRLDLADMFASAGLRS